MATCLIDTGPIVAALVKQDTNHQWAKEQWRRFAAPLSTTEAVLSESFFLLQRRVGNFGPLVELIRRGVIQVALHLDQEVEPIARLMTRYADVPMSLADAGLVRLAELIPRSIVLTVDSDFHRYRKEQRRVVPTMMPQ